MSENGTNMDSNNTRSRIPKLRFLGFTGEWEELPLSHFLFEHKTKSDGKCEVHSVSVAKGVVNQAAYLGRSYAAADTSKYNLAKPNDIIYTKSPTGAFPYGIVKQNKNPYNVIVSPLYAVYSPINKYIGYIIDSYFENPVTANNYLSSLVQKGAKNTIQISNDTFVSKTVCLPTNPAEQQKIASCLLELDNLISAQSQKVDALKEKKKGMMQQLFPQKGETVPRLRFPGFIGDWEEKKLSDCLLQTPDYGLNLPAVPFSNNLPVYLRITDISEDGHYIKEKKASVHTVLTKDNSLQEGDIVFARTGASVGKTYKYRVEDGLLVFAGFLIRIKPDETQMDSEFLFQYTQTNAYKKWVEVTSTRSGQPGINSIEISSLSIPFTIPAEQHKIAECLSALDETIVAESDKLEALKNHKKALMQQLFPQPAK